MKKLYFLFLVGLVISCIIQQEAPENNSSSIATEASSIENQVILKDSLTVLRLTQTDPTAILMGHVILKDDVIILDLTEEDARSLGISSELYTSFKQQLSLSNEE